tara:strand:+ start:226 stop:765 length:540 start_codon:yes stop_codon:yes gene_type:complete
MKNLTEKQQTIIANITNEFAKINEEKKNRPKGGLFDIDGLLGQREADIEERYQIERNNEFYDEIFQTKIQEDMDTLNIDLRQLGLRAWRPLTWAIWVRGFVIDTIENFERDYHYEKNIIVKYRLFTKTKYFESGISYIEESSNKHNIECCSKFFNNLEEFAKDINVIGKIKVLINKTNI